MIAALVSVGLAIDLGNLYLSQRSLQRMANMAALDAAIVNSGCLAERRNPLARSREEARASVQRNGGQPDWLDPLTGLALGQRHSSGGVYRFLETTADRASAVRVSLQRPLPQRLIPVFAPTPEGRLIARAAAEALPHATVNVGSFLADASPPLKDSMLCALLDCGGLQLDLGVLGYEELFSAEVTLSELVPGDPDEEEIPRFLDEPVTVDGLLGLLADALAETGQLAAATVVQTIADASDAVEPVLPGEVFGVVEGLEGPLSEAVLNAGQLVVGLAETVGQGNAVTAVIDGLGLLPALGPVTMIVRRPDGSTTVVGPGGFDETGEPFTEAASARGFLQLDLDLGSVSGSPASLSLFVELASARARLDGIDCARRGQPQTRVLMSVSYTHLTLPTKRIV